MKYQVSAFALILSVFCAALIAEVTSVVEIPAAKEGDTIAIFISGDGGWRKIDQDISMTLASQGIYIVGVNSMRYFWKKRTPYEAAGDFNILINKYAAKTNRKHVLIIGYSFGADVAPYIINRPSTPIESGMKKFIVWYKNYYSLK